MREYTDIFNKRGDLYNEAVLINPHARKMERQILIDLLQLLPHHVVCDVPAGGGYLAEGICNYLEKPDQIICVEPSVKFAECIDSAFTKRIAPMNELPFAGETVDRIGSLTGLHHFAEKACFFNEAHRILKKTGILAVADVLDGTSVGNFLNGPVDRYSSTGHHGLFLQKGECEAMLREAGFNHVQEQHISYFWTFDSEEQMARYFKSLFGLINVTLKEVNTAIECYFEYHVTDKGVQLPWSLLYGVGKKEY